MRSLFLDCGDDWLVTMIRCMRLLNRVCMYRLCSSEIEGGIEVALFFSEARFLNCCY